MRIVRDWKELFPDELTPIEMLQKESMNWRITKPLLKRLLKKFNNGKKDANTLGRVGECFVSYHINRTFHKYGYRWRKKLIPMSYQTHHLYRGYAGIDFYVKLMDSYGETYSLMIEVTNWKPYRRLDYFYETRLLSKFKRLDKQNRCFHLICINRRNAERIKELAKRDGIIIIPLREHYTKDFLQRRIENKDTDEETIW
jgi:hypothetical protein